MWSSVVKKRKEDLAAASLISMLMLFSDHQKIIQNTHRVITKPSQLSFFVFFILYTLWLLLWQTFYSWKISIRYEIYWKICNYRSLLHLFAIPYCSKKLSSYCYWRIMNVLFCANVNVCVSMHTIESERGGEGNRLHSKINTIPLINQEASKIICQP